MSGEKEFNKVEKEILIDFVRMNPRLYNLQHLRYKDKELKKRLWEQVGKRLNKSGKYIYKQFTHNLNFKSNLSVYAIAHTLLKCLSNCIIICRSSMYRQIQESKGHIPQTMEESP